MVGWLPTAALLADCSPPGWTAGQLGAFLHFRHINPPGQVFGMVGKVAAMSSFLSISLTPVMLGLNESGSVVVPLDGGHGDHHGQVLGLDAGGG